MAAAAPPPLQTALTRDFPGAASLTRQDLEALLGSSRTSGGASASAAAAESSSSTDDQAFEAFVGSLPEVQAMQQESQKLLRLSEEKAARNVTLQPDLESLRAETQRLYDRARSFEAQWPQVEAGMNEAYRRFSPSTLHFGLTQSASKLHDESESLASAFAEGLPLDVATSAPFKRGLTPPDSGTATPTRGADGGSSDNSDAAFVRRYRALRTTYHRRSLMAERWARGAVTWRDD